MSLPGGMEEDERSQSEQELLSDARSLARVPLFSDLEDESLRSLASVAWPRTYARGQFVMTPDDRRRDVLIITAGGIRIYRLSPSGHEITLEQVDCPDIYGLVFLHRSVEPRSFVTATVEDTVVYRVSTGEFRTWLGAHPSVAVAALALISYRLAEARDRMADLALYDVKARLAHTLARLAAGNPGRAVLSTHEQLARLVGTRQEEVTKALRYFRTHGLVAYRPHQRGILVLDVEALSRYGVEST